MARTFAMILAVFALAACGSTSSSTDGGSTDSGASTCQSIGGSCTGVGQCGVGTGDLTDDANCNSANIVCCLPTSACPTEDFVCCSSTASFRPSCDHGQLVCASGQTKSTNNTCP